MQLRRIEIRDFRKLGAATIGDIGDGLSVVVGDNEAGKSTVLAALRAVLFERHRVSGDAVRRMLPYGQNVRPEVAIEFELGGAQWRLRKAFNQRQEAELVGPGERITGDAVEDRLAELFAFTPPGRGESKREEHQGLYGLLWVEQGRSHHSLGVGGGRDTLASALEGEVGQVIGGERGRALLAAAAERKDSFWGRNDKPRGDYRLLAERLQELQDRRGVLAESLRQHDDRVAALASKEEALARHKRDERLPKAAAALQAAREQLASAEGLERAVEEAALRFESRERDRVIAAEGCARRGDLIRKVEEAEAQAARTTQVLAEAREFLSRRQKLAESAEKQHEAARESRIRAEEAVRHLELALARRRRLQAVQRETARLAQAETYASGRREAAAAAAAIEIGPKDVAKLEALLKTAEQARSELRAASVQISFEPEDGRTVAVDGVCRTEAGPLHLSRDAVLDLQGFGRLLVRPGGGIGPLAAAADRAAQALGETLRELGFPDASAARAALMRKSEFEREALAQGKLLAAIAPQGLESLRQAVETERAALAGDGPETVDVPEAGDGSLVQAERIREAAAETERAAEAASSDARSGREQAARELAVLEERVANARSQLEARVAELAGSRAQADDGHLRDRLQEAERSAEAARAEVARARAAFDATDPTLARLDFERAERAERVIRADIEALTSEKRDLEVELGVLGRRGLGEELAEVEGQIERLGREKAAKDVEAAASRLLLDALTEAQRESKERWLGPVRERVKPYLRFLEPESEIVLNEQSFEIEAIRRRGVSEPFHALSMGAREQVAVITRLALADVLRAAGRPSALILDDALVNTDEGRLERMHRVLQTAAASLQILVLTCRERDFVGLGDIKRL